MRIVVDGNTSGQEKKEQPFTYTACAIWYYEECCTRSLPVQKHIIHHNTPPPLVLGLQFSCVCPYQDGTTNEIRL